jgi:hypothetical protein
MTDAFGSALQGFDAELCRREGLNENVYYRRSKEFLGAGEKRLAIRGSARKNQVARGDRSSVAAGERA